MLPGGYVPPRYASDLLHNNVIGFSNSIWRNLIVNQHFNEKLTRFDDRSKQINLLHNFKAVKSEIKFLDKFK